MQHSEQIRCSKLPILKQCSTFIPPGNIEKLEVLPPGNIRKPEVLPPGNIRKPGIFLMFSGNIEMEHWLKMG